VNELIDPQVMSGGDTRASSANIQGFGELYELHTRGV
jgi:hypothetical protein